MSQSVVVHEQVCLQQPLELSETVTVVTTLWNLEVVFSEDSNAEKSLESQQMFTRLQQWCSRNKNIINSFRLQ